MTFPIAIHAGGGDESRRRTARCRANPAVRRAKFKIISGRISGPLLDRIDLHMEVPQCRFGKSPRDRSGETFGADPRARGGRAPAPAGAIQRQAEDHLQRPHGHARSEESLLPWTTATMELLEFAMSRHEPERPRVTTASLRVARTIADLAGSEQILPRPRFRSHPVSARSTGNCGVKRSRKWIPVRHPAPVPLSCARNERA